MTLTKQNQSRGLSLIDNGRVELHNEAGFIATVRNQRELDIAQAAYVEGYMSGQIAIVTGVKGE